MGIIATILSIKNWPFLVEYGFSSLLFLVLATLLFFLPISLISAELASGWPEKGGVFTWIKEALGGQWAFFSIWAFWVSNVIWYPTMLSFIAATLSYAIAPELATNAFYTFSATLLLFWIVLFGNFFGVAFAGWLNSIALILGTLLPGVIIIALGCYWFFSGKLCQIDFSAHALLPQQTSWNEIVFLVGVLISFAGMEMNAIHAKNVPNPRKNYPKAIFLASMVIIFLSVLGTLSIGIVIPKDKINLVTAVIETISYYLNAYECSWCLPIVAVMIALGAFGGISTWLGGTSQALLVAGEEEKILPPFLYKTNRYKAPVGILVLQGTIVSVLSLTFFVMPDISSAFWILTALSSQLYLIMYMFLFLAAILLRWKRPEILRAYQIPGGKVGMLIVAGVGFFTSLFSLIISFLPPAQLNTGSLVFYESFLLIALFAFCLVPKILKNIMCQRVGSPMQ